MSGGCDEKPREILTKETALRRNGAAVFLLVKKSINTRGSNLEVTNCDFKLTCSKGEGAMLPIFNILY